VSAALDLLLVAEATARDAGALLVQGQRGTVEVTSTKSSPTDIVTAVDVASEDLIRRAILAARPDDGFVGEEGDDVPGTSGVVWIADPIDGTVNYLYGIPQFAVSIAAAFDGTVVAGVVHNPVSGETFTAALGEGSRLDGRLVSVGSCTSVSQALVGTGYSYRADVRARQAVEMSRLVSVVRDIRRIGSAALDLCYVACGRYDAYVERALRPWDLAAGRLVVTEAGGRVEGLHGEEPGELIVTAAGAQLYDAFHEALLDAGFGDWSLPGWPEPRGADDRPGPG
jgi:myo-inositol-1(or 4)-monophosphatase